MFDEKTSMEKAAAERADAQARKEKMLAQFEEQKKARQKMQLIVGLVLAVVFIGGGSLAYKMWSATKISVQNAEEEGNRNR